MASQALFRTIRQPLHIDCCALRTILEFHSKTPTVFSQVFAEQKAGRQYLNFIQQHPFVFSTTKIHQN
jgi:hypothetical protein